MSDGTRATIGAGDLIQTEDMGTPGKIPRSKLVLGVVDTDNGDVSASNPMPITGTVAGNVGGFTAISTASKTRPANTTAYAVGQILAESTSAGTAWTFPNCVRAAGGSGSILGALITDTANQTIPPQFELWLFTAPPSTLNDAEAFAPNPLDLENLVTVLSFQTFLAAAVNGVLQATEICRPFKCALASTSLYGVLVNTIAYVPVSQENFTVTLQIGED